MAPVGGLHDPGPCPLEGPCPQTLVSGRGWLWGHPDVRERVALQIPCPSQKQFLCGCRSERWGPQGQGTFANTTLNVNQLSLPWYL